MASKKTTRIAVFFTHGVSLELWEQRGMFSREVTFYEELARELGEVWFFTYGRNDARFASKLGTQIRLFPKRLPVPNLLYAILLPFLYWRELSQVQALRIHQLAGAIPAVITHWLMRKPLIVRGGFQWLTFARKQGASKLKQQGISIIERLSYRSANVIIHTTQADATFVQNRYGIRPEKIQVIPNFVDTDLFTPISTPKRPQSLCFVGRFEEQKNLYNLLDAIEGSQIHLVLYGDGSLKSELEHRAKQLNIHVSFMGRIANEELPYALNTCEACILPSWYEGNPKVLLEAMSCGLPCIGTNVEGIASLIKDGETGLLCDPSSPSIAQAIHTLFADQDLRNRLGHTARTHILESASLTQVIQRECPFYDSQHERV